MNTFPERPGYEQAQRLFSTGAHLPLGLVEAATLLSYFTIRDAEDRDIPAAAAYRPKKHTDFYLGTVLLELALYRRIHMDGTAPFENHAFYYDQKQKQQSMKRLWFVVPLLALFLAGIIAFLLSQQWLAGVLFLSFGAYILLTILFLMVLGVFLRGKTAQGKLEVVDPTPTGNSVLDEITERRLVEQGWITLTGVRWVPPLGEVETLVINRHTDQWQTLSNQVRSALLLGDALSPEMLAQLLSLTLLGETFHTPRHIRLPGQSANQKFVSGLYQFLTSPEEMTIARQRLQALMRGDQAIAGVSGLPLYDTLLSIRNGVECSVESRQQASSG